VAKADETLDFKVIEFSKENKKIIVSHTKIAQDAAQEEKAKTEAENKRKDKESKKSIKANNENIERATLGDIEVLSNLKSEMQKSEIEKLEAMAKREEEKKKKTAKKSEEIAEEPTVEEKSSEEGNENE